jgi:hypothetical protein
VSVLRRVWLFGTRSLFLLLAVLVLARTDITQERVYISRVKQLVKEFHFSLVRWEYDAVREELRRRLQPVTGPTGEIAQKDFVFSFLARAEEIAALKQDLAANAAHRNRNKSLERQLDTLLRQQKADSPVAERILTKQVGRVLREENLSWRGRLFPPLLFRLDRLPTLLVTSPRNSIQQRTTTLLAPDLKPVSRDALEDVVDQELEVSSLVVDLGGFSTYPTLVVERASLPALVDIIAHEWTHIYLAFQPLGWNYGASPQMATLNETVASIAGSEISAKVIRGYYPEFAPGLDNALEDDVPPPPRQPSSFDLAMRRIRLHTDGLLAQGKVDEAERYMARERQVLVAEGHPLRKLNQAYFAFYGTYATSPASVDPIGPQLRELRAQSGSLRAFLERVGPISSYEDWLAISPTE